MKKQFWILVPTSYQAEDKEELLMSFIDPDAEDRETVYLTKDVAEEEKEILNKSSRSGWQYEVKSVVIEIED